MYNAIEKLRKIMKEVLGQGEVAIGDNSGK